MFCFKCIFNEGNIYAVNLTVFSFTEPYHRLCVIPIVIQSIHVLPLTVYRWMLRLQQRQCTFEIVYSNVALLFATVVVVVVVRTFALEVCAERQLLCHRMKANVDWDVWVTYMLIVDLDRCLARDSMIRKIDLFYKMSCGFDGYNLFLNYLCFVGFFIKT